MELEASIFFLRLLHAKHKTLLFQHIDRFNDEIRILKTDLNSSCSLLENNLQTFFIFFVFGFVLDYFLKFGL